MTVETHDVHASCPICNSITVVTVPLEGLRAWHAGSLIQNALPTLSSTERELLMTGICNTCWNKSFGEE